MLTHTHSTHRLGVMIFVMFTCQYPFSKFGNFNTVIAAHLSEISVGGGKDDKKDVDYDEGNTASAGKSSAMMGAALELEQAALPEHYQLDNKTLKKLPNDDARDLCKKLLMMNEKYRLGYKGAAQVMKHRFFDGIDWEAMKNRTATPPAKPDTSRASVATGELDLLKLLGSGEGEGERAKEPKVSDRIQKMFENFSYNPYLEHPDDVRNTGDSGSDSSYVSSQSNGGESAGGIENGKKSNTLDPTTIAPPEVIGMNSKSNLSLGLAITEETLDPRTGAAITSDNPYNNYDPADLTSLPPETPVGHKRAKGGFYEIPEEDSEVRSDKNSSYGGTLRRPKVSVLSRSEATSLRRRIQGVLVLFTNNFPTKYCRCPTFDTVF